MTAFLKDVGGLRLTLLTATAICLPLVIWADTRPVGVGVLTGYIVPAVVVLLFFLLMLDALMNRVFMIEKAPAEKALLRRRMWLALAGAAGILLVWGPFYRSLLYV